MKKYVEYTYNKKQPVIYIIINTDTQIFKLSVK